MTTASRLQTIDQSTKTTNGRPCVATGTIADARRRVREREMLSRALARRLAIRAANFDREAARLELRGQGDAALVLRREANRIGELVLKEPAVGLASRQPYLPMQKLEKISPSTSSTPTAPVILAR